MIPSGQMADSSFIAEAALAKSQDSVKAGQPGSGENHNERLVRPVERQPRKLQLRTQTVRTNTGYRFHSPRAQATAERYGVTSASVLAVKP